MDRGGHEIERRELAEEDGAPVSAEGPVSYTSGKEGKEPHAPKNAESLAQAAERTSLSTKTLRRRIAAGKLGAYRDGPKILRVDPADVDKLLRPLRTAGL